MKSAYPVLMREGEKFIVVHIPDFQINTQGTDYADAMQMARDAISLMGIDMEDDRESIPNPSPIESVKREFPGDVVTLVDVDFAAFRRRHEKRTVRRNITLPAWLDKAANDAKINVSRVTQTALKQQLHIPD
ncbi:MAG: type II toxin-antitoxin system HicB family antitoxin [Oscillospiraceae bacterium]|jgi:predicted RNase H-like HicB family nuclease|nr:type II toxin-antitoxin system HicB family antitoxin [Oscillospiraceae bacterium]